MSKLDPRNPFHLLATGFGSGLAPRAPGTFGSIAALLPWWPLHFLAPLLYWLTVLAAFGIGVYACGRTARDQRTHDHGAIVWDEFVGMWIALAPLAAMTLEPQRFWLGILGGFLLFRLLDIWKPWPISWCDRNVHGGFGIMIDDALAGALAGLLLWAALAWT
jgi:phosphatidylglycerophosphatase A